MNILNLKFDDLDGGKVLVTYTMDESDFENYNSVLQDLENHVNEFYGPGVIRIAVKPKLPIPAGSSEPLHMYYPSQGTTVESVLEKMKLVETQSHVIRNQESILEDLMFGVVRQDKERIPYRLDCETWVQFNINGTTIDSTVRCKTVDMIVPNEWEGEFESVLEKIEQSLIHHGFTRGFGTTPEINPIRL